MPKRALIQKRPFLIASIATALAWFYLHGGHYPELFLIPLKGAAVGLLAAWLWLRHEGRDARLMAVAFAMAALGDMLMELEPGIGILLYFAFNLLALGIFIQHPRGSPTPLDRAIITVLLLGPAVITFLLAETTGGGQGRAFYALATGAMAAGAWSSTFPRVQVGAGAVLIVLADLLATAGMGPLAGSDIPAVLAWPIYYLGQFLIATGLVKTIRKRDPRLKLVRVDGRTLH